MKIDKKANSSKGLESKNETFTNYIKTNEKNKKVQFNELKRQHNSGINQMNKPYFNFTFLHKNMNIEELIEKYQQNPHLRINLKIVG